MDISYIINHLGEERDKYFNAVAPPIIQTSNFIFDNIADFKKAAQTERENHLYTRGNNPTVEILRKKIAALQGSEDALILSSGAGAISNAVISNVKVGDHVICVKNAYSWANRLLMNTLTRFGISTTFVEGDKVTHFENAIQENTTIIYLESPSTLFFSLQDLEAISKLAKKHNIITILDNSYSSPLSKSPFEFGIDIVLHSASKYIGGHSDVVAGVLCSSKKMMDKIFHGEYMTFGNIISPNNAWLLLRGLRTLPIRLRQSSISTQRIVNYFNDHPKVKQVFYPFLENHPQKDLVNKQMSLPMAQFTVEFYTQEESKIDAFCDALQYFLIAVSWGGYESLALPILGNFKGREVYVVRFYVGLENIEILLDDIEKAMKLL